MTANQAKTVFCDIDGTLLKHLGNLSEQMSEEIPILPKTLEKLNEWNRNGYYIILITGRKESMREITIKQLEKSKIFYDKLIMGLPRGQRVLINDSKPDMESTALAFTIQRNKGIGEIDI